MCPRQRDMNFFFNLASVVYSKHTYAMCVCTYIHRKKFSIAIHYKSLPDISYLSKYTLLQPVKYISCNSYTQYIKYQIFPKEKLKTVIHGLERSFPYNA